MNILQLTKLPMTIPTSFSCHFCLVYKVLLLVKLTAVCYYIIKKYLCNTNLKHRLSGGSGLRIHWPTQKTQVVSLGWEDPLEKKMTPNFSILAWNPMDRGAWQAAVHRGLQKSRTRLGE